MSFTFPILLVCVLHRDLLVHQKLPVHICNRRVTSLEIREGHKSIPFSQITRVPRQLWRGHQSAKSAESIKQHTFINPRVEVTNPHLGPHFNRLLFIGGGLVDANGFPEQPHLVHDFCGVFGVGFCGVLDEAVALVGLGDAVFGEVDVGDAAGLEH